MSGGGLTYVAQSPRELTPAQHAFIRRQLFLIPIYIWTVYAWGVFAVHLPIGPLEKQTHLTRDFLHFYAQGTITREHDAYALYDIDAMAAVADRVVPVPVDIKFPPVYGPQVGLLFTPIAMLPYVPALIVWLFVTIAGYLACVYAVWRQCPALRGERWTVAVLALGWAGFHFTLSFGQASLVATVCMAALWLALKGERPFLAGLAVGALAYKPQLGIVAAFVFVLGQEWRVVAGAVTAVAVQFGASWAYWGAGIFAGYIGALRKLPGVIDAMEPDKVLMHSWRSLFLQLGMAAGPALVLSIVTSLATIAFAVAVWRTRAALAPRYVVLVLSTLLVDPHIFSYDLMLLAPALLVAWQWAWELEPVPLARVVPFVGGPLARMTARQAVVSLAGFVYMAPLLTIVLEAVPVQWSVVSFVALTLLCGAILRTRLTLASLLNSSGSASTSRL